jgi:hypothetical protein
MSLEGLMSSEDLAAKGRSAISVAAESQYGPHRKARKPVFPGRGSVPLAMAVSALILLVNRLMVLLLLQRNRRSRGVCHRAAGSTSRVRESPAQAANMGSLSTHCFLAFRISRSYPRMSWPAFCDFFGRRKKPCGRHNANFATAGEQDPSLSPGLRWPRNLL